MVSKRRIVSACGAAGLLVFGGGCATTDAPGAGAAIASKSSAVPANYRGLVVRYLAANNQGGKVLKAEISRPGVWESPLGLTSPRPIVCAKWVAQGPFIQQSHSLAFTFEGGKIAEVFDPGYINPAAGGAFAAALKDAATCGKLAYGPFPEMVKAK
jgi:hypothetical protein